MMSIQNGVPSKDRLFPSLLDQLEARLNVAREQSVRLEALADLVVGQEPENVAEGFPSPPIDCFYARLKAMTRELELTQNHISAQISRLEEF